MAKSDAVDNTLGFTLPHQAASAALAIGLCLVAARSALPASLCSVEEIDYFSCSIGKAGKAVSLCGSDLFSPGAGHSNSDAWLQYRFGRPDKVELAYPTERRDSVRKFVGEHVRPYQDSVDTIWFKNGDVTYGIEIRSAKNKFAGVWIARGQSEAKERRCSSMPQNASAFMNLVLHLRDTK